MHDLVANEAEEYNDDKYEETKEISEKTCAKDSIEAKNEDKDKADDAKDNVIIQTDNR